MNHCWWAPVILGEILVDDYCQMGCIETVFVCDTHLIASEIACHADTSMGCCKQDPPSAIAASGNQTKFAKSFDGTQPFSKACFLISGEPSSGGWDVHPNRGLTRNKPAVYVNHSPSSNLGP